MDVSGHSRRRRFRDKIADVSEPYNIAGYGRLMMRYSPEGKWRHRIGSRIKYRSLNNYPYCSINFSSQLDPRPKPYSNF